MSKLYRQPIEVETKDGLPTAFLWRDLWYQVTSCTVIEVLPSRFEPWRSLEPTRHRCETRQGLACDLVQDGEVGWVLERVWD